MNFEVSITEYRLSFKQEKPYLILKNQYPYGKDHHPPC